jgi:hypothetical protein
MARKPQAKITKRTVRVRLEDLKLLDLNAHYMRHETFQQLVANIKRDGCLLGNSPFAAIVPKAKGQTHIVHSDGREEVLDAVYLVLSGNHRVKASIEAGLEFEDIALTDDDLPEQRRVAIQLSQNALTGEDDPATLKKLYEKLDTVDWRDYAGLDDKALELLEQVKVGGLSEANLSFQTITVAFLPGEADAAREAWDAARAAVMSKPDEAWVARLVEHEKLLDALDLTGKSYGVKNIAVALEAVLEIFARHKTDLSEGFLEDWDEPRPGFENAWVPLETIFGSSDVPAASAGTIRRALKQMRKNDDVSADALWMAIEFWAASYLAELQAEKEAEQSG